MKADIQITDGVSPCGMEAARLDPLLTAGSEISVLPAPRLVVNRRLDIAGLGGDVFGLAVASDNDRGIGIDPVWRTP